MRATSARRGVERRWQCDPLALGKQAQLLIGAAALFDDLPAEGSQGGIGGFLGGDRPELDLL